MILGDRLSTILLLSTSLHKPRHVSAVITNTYSLAVALRNSTNTTPEQLFDTATRYDVRHIIVRSNILQHFRNNWYTIQEKRETNKIIDIQNGYLLRQWAVCDKYTKKNTKYRWKNNLTNQYSMEEWVKQNITDITTLFEEFWYM